MRWTRETRFSVTEADWQAILRDGELVAEVGLMHAQDLAQFIVDALNEKEEREHPTPPQPGDLLYPIWKDRQDAMRTGFLGAIQKIVNERKQR